MLNNSSLLITGGTGSFGKALTRRVLQKYPDIKRLVIFSRDELKQYEMAQEFPSEKYPNIRFFIGDVRNEERLRRALERIDYVVHAAALKQVPAAEYNPIEFIQTNVMGAQNMISACMDTDVRGVVALSTDKAAAPINLYGATKLCSDKLFIAANNITSKDIRFSVVRYGNVMGSRGSVIPFFMNKRSEGVLPITEPTMTRFNITLDHGVDLVLHALEHSMGGELYVPRIPSYRIMDLAEAIGPDCEHPVVGIRPGEKVHEEMITEADSLTTWDHGDFFTILPVSPRWNVADWAAAHGATKVKEGFHYTSANNSSFLTVDEIRDLIREHIDSGFVPGISAAMTGDSA
ncbi:MAG: UDP-N-acetylglucosamine 4,6-dehydratase (inverting) [Phycisphaerae bacterium]|nr:UDP-N-acetylglucosamine 4,6-dehydratase (inverting) [Phycisphaerae bacterium]|tara:strand:+ start:7300 stop:8340 length:1041 start_codon:yes stop_codon:yes gene_type:complete